MPPSVMSEEATLDAALAGRSLARFGDGELKLARERDCVSQKASPALASELKAILKDPGEALVCIPNLARNAKGAVWKQYGEAPYAGLYGEGPYGSAFITRPDSAPWIDTPDYWAKVRSLWAGKDIVFVTGARQSSLRLPMLDDAASVRQILTASHRDAYEEIDALEAEIGTPAGPVILCLGPCATVLAWRLAKKGVHALDLGHIGQYMRAAGAYRYTREDLLSDGYRDQLVQLHRGKWGADGAKHLSPVLIYADELKAETVLDYGCGEGMLAQAAAPTRRILNYDAGVPGREAMPKPVDLVVCTDVLEHVEPEKLDNVLDHIFRLAGRGAYLVIATRPANAILPDGRNAHLIVEPASWWLEKLKAQGWTISAEAVREGRDLTVWLRK